MPEPGGISVVIITWNEAHRIRRCLESVRWADEIIVVDQHSTDGTPAVCREYGATVISREMTRGFGDQKNFAIRHASRPWILSLDADEVVTSELHDSIVRAAAEPSAHTGYRMARLTNFLGRFIRHCGWYPNPVLRLFRAGAGRVTDAFVHEEVVVDGSVGDLAGDLLHYSYDSLDEHIRKMNLYTGYDARMLARRGVRLTSWRVPWYFIAKPLTVFLRKYVLQRGFRDGRHGLVLSAMAAIVTFCNYAKLWELTRPGAVASPDGDAEHGPTEEGSNGGAS
jgi:glycosyltransferase involved in cell wall biosynthesis